MTHKKAALVLLVVIFSASLYLVLTGLLGIREYWAGFLFLSQWGLMEQARVERLPHSVIGAFTGTLLAALLIYLPPLIGAGPGLAVALVAILGSVYALTVGWAPLAINAATMIFLTVVTIPEVSKSGRTNEIFVGLAAGVVFFGGGAALVHLATKMRRGAPDPGTAPV